MKLIVSKVYIWFLLQAYYTGNYSPFSFVYFQKPHTNYFKVKLITNTLSLQRILQGYQSNCMRQLTGVCISVSKCKENVLLVCFTALGF